MPVITGIVASVTLMLAVTVAAHWPAFGVNVSVMFPLRPAGSKLLALTPCPDQFPVIPFWVVGNAIGISTWQIVAGTPVITGVVSGLTVMAVVAVVAHCPAFGVNVSVMLPFNPAGLKLLALTPCPDQFPVIPLCVVGSAIGAAD